MGYPFLPTVHLGFLYPVHTLMYPWILLLDHLNRLFFLGGVSTMFPLSYDLSWLLVSPNGSPGISLDSLSRLVGVSLCLMVSHPCLLCVSGALVFAGALGTRVTKCLGSPRRYSFEYLGTILVKCLIVYTTNWLTKSQTSQTNQCQIIFPP